MTTDLQSLEDGNSDFCDEIDCAHCNLQSFKYERNLLVEGRNFGNFITCVN